MTDRTILDNARNVLLVTAGSFCLSLAGIASHSSYQQRLQSTERSEQATAQAPALPIPPAQA